MLTALWIAAGGAIGSLARFALAGALNESSHPWGTVVVNIVGSFALGVVIGLWGFSHEADHQVAITVGVLGGFTTFSTFALDTLHLWEDGQTTLAIVSVVISVAAGIGAAIAGLALGRALQN